MTVTQADVSRNSNDWIRNTTAVYNPKQNSVRDKIQSETKFSPRKNLTKMFSIRKIFCQKKIVRKSLSSTLSLISSPQSELSLTNRCLSSPSGTYIPQLGVETISNTVFPKEVRTCEGKNGRCSSGSSRYCNVQLDTLSRCHRVETSTSRLSQERVHSFLDWKR